MKRYFFLVVFIFGCTHQSSGETQLHQDMGVYLSATVIAQQQAAAHWDHLIFGELVDCQQGLPVPAPFNLSQTEADRYPQSLPIRDHLNAGIGFLTQSAEIWDSICAEAGGLVLPEAANRGYRATQQAESELGLAQNLYTTWNP
jgi:hypothetical protein